MTKAAVFTLKIEPELRAAFMAEAEAAHRPASQVVRELMRAFVEQQRDNRDHAAYLQRKVDIARTSIREEQGRSDAAVDADFAVRRNRIIDAR